MKKVRTEEQLRTDLRELTEASRRARKELLDMLTPAAPSAARRFLQQQESSRDHPYMVADRRQRKHQRKDKKGTKKR